MSLSRKHYENIATAINLNKERGVDSVIAALSSYFKNDNEHFDEFKFKEACRVDGNRK